MIKTPKQIEDAIKARTAEGTAIINAHEADRAAFNQRAAERQLKVTQIEGMIIQLRAMLPKPKGKDKADKKKK